MGSLCLSSVARQRWSINHVIYEDSDSSPLETKLMLTVLYGASLKSGVVFRFTRRNWDRDDSASGGESRDTTTCHHIVQRSLAFSSNGTAG